MGCHYGAKPGRLGGTKKRGYSASLETKETADYFFAGSGFFQVRLGAFVTRPCLIAFAETLT